MTSARSRNRVGENADELAGRVVGRHRALLTVPEVRTWWEARTLRSRLNADQLLRQLGFVLERISLDPKALLMMARKQPAKLRELLIRNAARLREKGRLDSYIQSLHKGPASFFRFHHVDFDGFPSLSPIKGASLEREQVPSPEELGRVLKRLSLRGQVTALFMAHAGVRPGVLGGYQAEGGLTLAALPDLNLTPGGPVFKESPFTIRVPAKLSKTRKAYTTFGSSELEESFVAYLRERREGGERLTEESPVVISNPTRGAAKVRQNAAASRFLTTKAVVEEVREALQATVPKDVTWRPYVLRSYCSTRFLIAGERTIPRDLREAILGHDSGVAGRYNVGKTWGKELLAEARACYKRAEPYLLTNSTRHGSEQEAVTRALKIMLQARGVPASKLETIDLANKTDEEIIELLKTVGALEAEKPERRAQKAVPIEDVPKLLEEGWELVQALNGSLAVLRAPEVVRGA